MKRVKITRGIMVGVTPELQKKIQEAADGSGMSVSEWVRTLVATVFDLTKKE